MAQKKPGRKKEPKPKRGIAWPRWTGFRGMTVRDWMQLLIVPLAIVVVSFVFTMQQNVRQQQIESQRAKAERNLAEQRAQNEALQAYFDQMSTLLLEKDLRNSDEDSDVRKLARARTLTVLGRLDPSRKTAVMQYLVEAELVQRVGERDPIIGFSGADLRDADLEGANLSYTFLSGVVLEGADLTSADLSYVDLSDANLSAADLEGADLSGANLSGANLSGANLSSADLSYADLTSADLSTADLEGGDLSYADLEGADLSYADLRDADFRDALGVTKRTLEAQDVRLEGVTMPDGSQQLACWLIPDETTEYETILQRLEAQGAQSRRSRDAKKGGC